MKHSVQPCHENTAKFDTSVFFCIDTMINWGLLGAILTPNVGGWLSTFPMRGQVKRPDGKAWYQLLNKPPWTPPDWLFGPAWTVLYCSMGYASYRVYQECGGFTGKAINKLTIIIK